MSVKMCSVGDLKNNLKILQSEARLMKYTGDFDLDGLAKGNPHTLLPLYHHAFNSYNSQFTTEVMELIDDSLYMKSDVRFMEAVYRVLRDLFNFKPSVTKEQFFTMNNFAERKIIMCVDVLRLVQNRCRLLGPKCPTNPNIKVAPIVNTRRPTKKSATDLVVSEPSSETAHSAPEISVNRKVAKGNTKPMSSLMGIDENNWQVKVGYLQPCKDRPVSRGEKSSGRKTRENEKSAPVEEGVVASMVREFTPHDAVGKGSTVEVHRPCGDRQDKGPLRVADHSARAHNDWDPTGAMECILAKVKDLPVQLTSFMKAVDTRLQKIENRLEKVENCGVFRTEDSPQDKHILDTLQARLLLLENRLILQENKTTGEEIPASGKKTVDSSKTVAPLDAGKRMLEEKKSAGEFNPGPFVSLERGEDLFSTSLVMSTFSPIRQDLNTNDTLTSFAADDSNPRRLSSTPNQSPLNARPASRQPPLDAEPASNQPPLNARPACSQSPLSSRPPRGPTLSSSRPPPAQCGSSPAAENESENERRAAAAVSAATADSTITWETLDMSTQQQVERIREMLKATQVLLPSGHQQQVDT